MAAKFTRYWEQERAACIVCGRSYLLTLDGTVRKHFPDAYDPTPCPGSHEPPARAKTRPKKQGPVARTTLRYRALAELARRRPDEFQAILEELREEQP